MKQSNIILIVVIVVVLGIAGLWFGGVFQREAAEEAAENAIEAATNGSANVELDTDGSMIFETDEATMEINSGGAELPDGFPTDVYVVDGTIQAAASTAEDAYTLTIQTDKAVADVKAEYQEQLAAEGWAQTLSIDLEGGSSLSAEKDNRTLTVSISHPEDMTIVVVGVYPQE